MRPEPRWRLVSRHYLKTTFEGKFEAVVQTNIKKATNFGLSFFTGRYIIIFMLNQHNALDKIGEMF